MADTRNTDARAERGDAALVAQYIHELSERHGRARDPLEDEPEGEEDGG
jgi:hypothetical protein